MSKVNVINVKLHKPKALFMTPIIFEVFFEALEPLRHTLMWRIIYFGSPTDSHQDQILEEAEMDGI
jgi:hypothetical protein